MSAFPVLVCTTFFKTWWLCSMPSILYLFLLGWYQSNATQSHQSWKRANQPHDGQKCDEWHRTEHEALGTIVPEAEAFRFVKIRVSSIFTTSEYPCQFAEHLNIRETNFWTCMETEYFFLRWLILSKKLHLNYCRRFPECGSQLVHSKKGSVTVSGRKITKCGIVKLEIAESRKHHMSLQAKYLSTKWEC